MDYADYPVIGPVGLVPFVSKWHSKHALLAVGGKVPTGAVSSTDFAGSVHVFDHDGNMIEGATVQRSAPPTKIEWHPTGKILAMAFASGEILVWNHSKQTLFECQSLHTNSVSVLEWSPGGSLLLSGDEKGQVGLWKAADTGKLGLAQDYKRPSGITQSTFGPDSSADAGGIEQPFYYVSTSANEILMGSTGPLQLVATEEAAVETLLFDKPRNTIVAFSRDLMLVQHTLDSTGNVSKSTEAKLAGRELTGACWAGPSILAIGTNQNSVRMWDLTENELSMLQLKQTSAKVIDVACDIAQGLLVGACAGGEIYIWQFQGDRVANAESFADKWEAWPGIQVESVDQLTGVCLGGSKGNIAVQGSAGLSILRRQAMNAAYGGGTTVVQVSARRLIVESGETNTNVDTGDINIEGLSANGSNIVIWSGTDVCVYQLISGNHVARSVGLFSSTTLRAVVHHETVFVCEEQDVFGKSFDGTNKQQLRIGDSDGIVTCVDVNQNFLLASNSKCWLSIWDVSKHQARLVAPPKCVKEDVDEITSSRVNSDGTLASFIAKSGGEVDPAIWVWDASSNAVHTFDFSTAGRVPLSHHWSSEEPTLLAVEAGEGDSDSATGTVPNEVVTMFVTAEDGIIVQHRILLGPADGLLIGIAIPYVLHVDRAMVQMSEGAKAVDKRVIPSFTGLEGATVDVKKAMLAFSYNLAINNMDEAFKAVRAIKNEKVWESMARMCVESRRMDVASVCVGSMKNAVAARALRESLTEPEPEVQAACLATHLGMFDSAEELYKECGRYDLLNRFYQDSGRWEDALEVAKRHDRPHLRATQYNYGKFLEACGKPREAERRYEASLTHHFEVPRMYTDDPDQLKEYIRRSGSQELEKWWAQFLESSQDMAGALEFYSKAGDSLSQARVHCYCGDMDRAKEIVDESGNASAAYHLARQYENQEMVNESIAYYEKAGCYSSAIRIAKEHGRREEIGRLAMQSNKYDQIEAAQYFESQAEGSSDKTQVGKAVKLYHLAGRVGKALELCFEHGLTDDMPEDFGDVDDPALLKRAAEFFIKRGRFEKAVNLLITSQEYDQAIELCKAQGVTLSDELAETFTLEKGSEFAGEKDEFRNSLLERVADLAAGQGNYHLATKKFTQAGNKLRAMKALLKCQDTQKIIYFASKCRSKDIYVLAANYLQTLDWRSEAEVLDNIIAFYTKGKALDKLSSFYESAAQNEIDDYQSYDKALHALKEASQYLDKMMMNKAKVKNIEDIESRVNGLNTKIELIHRFVDIKELRESNPEEMMGRCHALLEEPDIDFALRIGDVYGLMIDCLASTSDFAGAYEMMKTMRERIPNVNISYYVDLRVVETIENALGIAKGHGRGAEETLGEGRQQENGEEMDDDDIAEDVIERPGTSVARPSTRGGFVDRMAMQDSEA